MTKEQLLADLLDQYRDLVSELEIVYYLQNANRIDEIWKHIDRLEADLEPEA